MAIEEIFAKVAEKTAESKIDESIVKPESADTHNWAEDIPNFNESDSRKTWGDDIPDFYGEKDDSDWGNDIPDFSKQKNDAHIEKKEIVRDTENLESIDTPPEVIHFFKTESSAEHVSNTLQESNQNKLEKQESDAIDIDKQTENHAANLDDNGIEYKDADGNLLPNTEYEINGIKYQTDENGRIISWDGELQDTPENGRDNDAQKEAGGSDRQEGDHGGHLVARMNGGAEGNENMVALRGHINQSDYKRGENEENQMLKDGKEVNESGKVSYDGDSSRPSKIEKTYTDGDKTVKATYDN